MAKLTGEAAVIAAHWPAERTGRVGGWGSTPMAKRAPRVYVNPKTGSTRTVHDSVDCSCGQSLRANKHKTVDQVWAQHVSNEIVVRRPSR